jgi:Ca2+-binding EF-hand superfamily protein
MKIIQIVTIAALALGLSQVAYANHDGTDGKHCDRMHNMQDVDTNKDGSISREEFADAHKARSEKMFDMMDSNHDGKLDQAERQAGSEKMKDRCKMNGHKMLEMEQEKSKK